MGRYMNVVGGVELLSDNTVQLARQHSKIMGFFFFQMSLLLQAYTAKVKRFFVALKRGTLLYLAFDFGESDVK